MQSISTIGLDIAKSVFQVHGVDAAGQAVLRRQLRRRHVLASKNCRRAWWVSRRAPHALLVLRAAGVRAYGAIDAAGLCEALQFRARAAIKLGRRESARRVGVRSSFKAEFAQPSGPHAPYKGCSNSSTEWPSWARASSR